MIFSLFRPLLFLLDGESAHKASLSALSLLPQLSKIHASDSVLRIQFAGLDMPSPIGLAAGFDKDAQVPLQALRLGFGAVEVGTLTPLPQDGNPKPRLFRLVEDEAVINRMGFNNKGQASAIVRLKNMQRRRTGVIGINVGANKDASDRIADYALGVSQMSHFADYITINISSPNTPGLRTLQGESALTELLAAVNDARIDGGPPVFLKVAPDLEPAEIDMIARVSKDNVDALIVSNTTIGRPPLKSRYRDEQGGLSGRPLKDLAHQRMADFRRATGGKIPLIGAGGISSGADAYARIRAGASMVQLYSALVFYGPGLVKRINRDLKALLVQDGFSNVSQAVGVDV